MSSRKRSRPRRQPKKKVFWILGTSSTGKSSLTKRYLLPNVPHSVYLSTDNIWDELVKTCPRGVPWREYIIPLVYPTLFQHIKDIKNKVNFVDDNNPNLLDADIPNSHFILLYTPLPQLLRQIKSRTDYRPITGVLANFSQFYTTSPTSESILVDTISKKDIQDYLTADPRDATALQREKAFKKACRAMKIKGDARLPLYTRRYFDTVVNTLGLSNEGVYQKIKHLF